MNSVAQNPSRSSNAPQATVSDSDYRRICELLYREATLLASQDYTTWLTWMAPEVRYRVPLQTFQQRRQERNYGGDSAWYDESLDSLTFRVEQHADPSSNAERVPSFLRYFVTNIFASELEDGFAVDSQVLVLRVRANQPAPFLLSGARQDHWVSRDDQLLLARREVTLDMPYIEASNLAFFL